MTPNSHQYAHCRRASGTLALVACFLTACFLTFGLGTRDITRNIVAGYYVRKLFKVGDSVEVAGEKDRPVRIQPLHDGRPWGSVGVVRARRRSRVSYLAVHGGSQARIASDLVVQIPHQVLKAFLKFPQMLWEDGQIFLGPVVDIDRKASSFLQCLFLLLLFTHRATPPAVSLDEDTRRASVARSHLAM